ncbi:MAG: hypothetical protein HY722_04420 [Planctomycetes bacterium]|nr:hypothetical protein [Planctomycetota bacterium]
MWRFLWVGLLIVFVILELAVSYGQGIVPAKRSVCQLQVPGNVFGGDRRPVEGVHDVVFSIYEAPEGGTALWTEAQAGVPFTMGWVQTTLGRVRPLESCDADPARPIFNGAERFLGVALDGGGELPRRLPMVPATFSFALNAAAVAGIPGESIVSATSGTMMYRGTIDLTGGEGTLALPPSFSGVVMASGITVHVTPLGDTVGVYVAEKSSDRVVVRECGGGKGSFSVDLLVLGQRKDL